MARSFPIMYDESSSFVSWRQISIFLKKWLQCVHNYSIFIMSQCNDNKQNIVYIYDTKLCAECDRLPTMKNRASIVHDLIQSLQLLNHMTIEKSEPATEDDLKLCHSSSYIDFIKKVSDVDVDDDYDFDEFEEEQLEFGLGYDCPILDKLLEFTQTIAGGSLTAAKHLISGKCKIAINWFGGWHHAQRDGAEGFCYINDIAIAIQKLSERYRRVMYIDFDIHHGNGVQNLFETSQRILTLSFHKYAPGFYPGTGNIDDLGFSKGKYYSLNVPFLEGVGDNSLIYCFNQIFPRIYEVFKPGAIVVQCGADGIRGDPVGQANLTPKSIGHCIKEILKENIPTLFLGGGGYHFANSARHWAYLTSVISNQSLPADIPDTCEFFTEYGPDFELEIPTGNMKDTNTEQYLQNIITLILDYCKQIQL